MAVFGRGLPREEDDAVRGRGRRAKSGAWRSKRIRFRHLNAPFVKVDSRRRTARKLGAMKCEWESATPLRFITSLIDMNRRSQNRDFVQEIGT